jgi:hypothetical protein
MKSVAGWPKVRRCDATFVLSKSDGSRLQSRAPTAGCDDPECRPLRPSPMRWGSELPIEQIEDFGEARLGEAGLAAAQRAAHGKALVGESRS